MQRPRAAVPLRCLNQHLFISGIGKTDGAAKIRSHFKAVRNGAFWDVLESNSMEEVACEAIEVKRANQQSLQHGPVDASPKQCRGVD
jgi:hypothetical protein